MSTRASTARHVRQRKLNTKQPLRIIREDELEETLDEEVQRQNIHQVETGVEKGEEVEFHLQAVINAAVGANKAEQPSYIPTPDAVRAKDVRYEALYPKAFRQPATYIRFSSTVEDSVGIAYCMDEEDHKFLTQQLHHGRDASNQPIKDFAKLVGATAPCSEDAFEEAMNFFEETSLRLQPFATVIPLDAGAGGTVPSTPILTLAELEQARAEGDEHDTPGASSSPPLSLAAEKHLPYIYPHWVARKTAVASRPLVPAIKVRLLDTTSEADDADPYVCFRRREVRQTRKTRGRDAQIVEKLKKLRLELEQARNLVQMVRRREELHSTQLALSRKVFEERRKLKEVKVSKGIKGENGEDELLLVNQKPAPKPKASRRDTQSQQQGQEPASAGGNGNAAAAGVQPRPATIRLRSLGDRPSASAPEDNLVLLADHHAEAETYVTRSIDSRKEQHRRWNHHWHDRTWNPITPPPESEEDEDDEGEEGGDDRRDEEDEDEVDPHHRPRQRRRRSQVQQREQRQQQQQQQDLSSHRAPAKWAPLILPSTGTYPTPPPSHKSGSPVDGDGDVEMSESSAANASTANNNKPSLSQSQSQDDHQSHHHHHHAHHHHNAHQHDNSQIHIIRAFSSSSSSSPPSSTAQFSVDNDDAPSMHAYFSMDNTINTTSSTDFPHHRQKNAPPPPPPACRIRYGRGGRRFLEARRRRPAPTTATSKFLPVASAMLRHNTSGGGVISDSDSDDDEMDEIDLGVDASGGGALANLFAPFSSQRSAPHRHHHPHQQYDYHPVPEYKIFEYRTMMNRGSGSTGAGNAAAPGAANRAAAAAAEHQQQQQQGTPASAAMRNAASSPQQAVKQQQQQQPQPAPMMVAGAASGDKKA